MSLSKLSLLLLVFIDAIGLGVVYSVLTPLYLEGNHFFSPDVSTDARYVWLGISFAVYPFFMLIGTFFLGTFSDRYGRRKSLLICIAGLSIGFLITLLGVWLQSLLLLLCGRFLSGITAGSDTLAQAALADMSAGHDRTRHLNHLSLAGVVGFVAGPAIGSFLGTESFLWVFGLCVCSFFSLYYFFNETYKPHNIVEQKSKEKLFSLLQQNQIFLFLAVYFLMLFGWNLYYQFSGVFMITYFQANPDEIGYFLSYIALVLALSIAFIVDPFIAKIKLRYSLTVSLILLFIGILGTVYIPSVISAWLCVIPLSLGCAIGYTACVSLISHNAPSHEQGRVMGAAGTFRGLSWTLAPLVAGVLAEIEPNVPLLLAAVCFFIAVGLSFRRTSSSIE